MNNKKLKFLKIENQDRVKLAIFKFKNLETKEIIDIKMTKLLDTHNNLLENMIKKEIQKKSSDRLTLSEIYEDCFNKLGEMYSISDIKNILITTNSLYYFAKIDIKVFTMINDLLDKKKDIFNNEERKIVFNILKGKYTQKEKLKHMEIAFVMSKMQSIGLQTNALNFRNLDLNDFNFKNLTDEDIESGYLILEKIPLDYTISDYPYQLNRFEIKK